MDIESFLKKNMIKSLTPIKMSKHLLMNNQLLNNKLSENQLVNQFLINKLFKQSNKNLQFKHYKHNQFKFYKIQTKESLIPTSKQFQKKNMKN